MTNDWLQGDATPIEGGAPTSPNDPLNRPDFLPRFGAGLMQQFTMPGAAMQPNPYPAGSEQAAWYDQNRQDVMNQWAPGMALGMIGAGTQFAEPGAVGVAGGRLQNFSDLVSGAAKPQFDPASIGEAIWQGNNGKMKGVNEEISRMRMFKDRLGRTDEEINQIENHIKDNLASKPFVSQAKLDRISEHVSDLRDNGKPVTIDALRAKFPKVDDATLSRFADAETYGVQPSGPVGRPTIEHAEHYPNDRIVYVDAAKADAAWQKDKNFYVGKNGKGETASPYKYDRAKEFLSTADSYNVPYAGVQNNGAFGFTDGRHRFAAMRDMGMNEIPVQMDPQSIENAARHGYLSDAETYGVGK